jgi:hypothetical protein
VDPAVSSVTALAIALLLPISVERALASLRGGERCSPGLPLARRSSPGPLGSAAVDGGLLRRRHPNRRIAKRGGDAAVRVSTKGRIGDARRHKGPVGTRGVLARPQAACLRLPRLKKEAGRYLAAACYLLMASAGLCLNFMMSNTLPAEGLGGRWIN